MATQAKPFDISDELAKLKHEKKNQKMHRLPANATIQRRPINHAPVASPFAGSQVQKVVYVSSKTPLMSAVKRVKRLLHEIEKRATQDVKLIERGERAGMRKLAEAREKLAKDGEEVLVKASGRAMQTALRVGNWFQSNETEMDCKVEVRTGSVSVVDDIIDVKEENESDGGVAVDEQEESTLLEGGDITLELLGEETKNTNEDVEESAKDQVQSSEQNEEKTTPSEEPAPAKKSKRKRKKRPVIDPDELPEQRLRWIKTVEVAVSFKS